MPTDHWTGLCNFCRNYPAGRTVEPMKQRPSIARQIDQIVNLADMARIDGNKVLDQLGDDGPLMVTADIVVALEHLRRAVLLLDQAADQLDQLVVR